MINRLVQLFILLPALTVFSDSQETVIHIPWGDEIHYRTTEMGEILSISGVFFIDSSLYLYDLADRHLIHLTMAGTLKQKIPMESIGRNNYIGDDFVIIDKKSIFLNTVDRRLEIFSIETGKHEQAIKYPYTYFSSLQKRRFRIINKIYVEDNTLLLGNNHFLFYFDLETQKALPDKNRIETTKECKILYYHKAGSLLQCGDLIKQNGKSFTLEKEVMPISGKNFFLIDKTLYHLRINFKGIYISEMHGDGQE